MKTRIEKNYVVKRLPADVLPGEAALWLVKVLGLTGHGARQLMDTVELGRKIPMRMKWIHAFELAQLGFVISEEGSDTEPLLRIPMIADDRLPMGAVVITSREHKGDLPAGLIDALRGMKPGAVEVLDPFTVGMRVGCKGCGAQAMPGTDFTANGYCWRPACSAKAIAEQAQHESNSVLLPGEREKIDEFVGRGARFRTRDERALFVRDLMLHREVLPDGERERAQLFQAVLEIVDSAHG